jgi:hypothetical protein
VSKVTALDFAVAQAAFRARQMERALHDNGPWTISWGPFDVPACRLVGEDRIVFLAHFPAHCYLAAPEAPATLLCRGEIVGTQAIEFPGDAEFEMEWTLAIGQPVTA